MSIMPNITILLGGLVAMILGLGQLYASVRALQQVKQHANGETSTFIGAGLWSGFAFGLIFVLGAIGIWSGFFN